MPYTDKEAARLLHVAIQAVQSALKQEVSPDWELLTAAEQDMKAAHTRQMRREKVTARKAHESWMALRLSEGWTWGPVTDKARKVHSALCPFEEIPVEEVIKDVLYERLLAAMDDEVPAST